MTARDEIAAHFTTDLVAGPLLDAHAAEVTAAAYRAAADTAEDVANELFGAYDTEQGNGAMAVAARLRARADQMEQQ